MTRNKFAYMLRMLRKRRWLLELGIKCFRSPRTAHEGLAPPPAGVAPLVTCCTPSPRSDADFCLAMSSHDVRDILSLPKRAQEPGPSRAPVRAPPILPGDARPKQRPEGMSRELYALLGPNAPSLVMGQADGPGSEGPGGVRAFQPKFQRKAQAAHTRKWMWTPFRNPARHDTPAESGLASEEGAPPRGLVLHHWRPLDPNAPQNDDEAPLDALWAPYNTESQVFHYTTDEYTQYLAGAYLLLTQTTTGRAKRQTILLGCARRMTCVSL